MEKYPACRITLGNEQNGSIPIEDHTIDNGTTYCLPYSTVSPKGVPLPTMGLPKASMTTLDNSLSMESHQPSLDKES